MQCGGQTCNVQLSPTKEKPTCSVCNTAYHFECSGVKKSTWDRRSNRDKLTWKCRSCQQKKGKRISEDDPQSSDAEEITRDQKSRMDTGLVEQLSQLLDTKLAALRTDLIQEINSSIDSKFLEFETRTDERVAQLQKENSVLKGRLDGMEQYTRRNNLVISGVPEVQNETPIETIIRVATAVSYDLKCEDVDICHRLPNQKAHGAPRNFLIKFVRRTVKKSFLVHCRKMKPTAERMGGSKDTKIYVNEHLTGVTQELRKYAKSRLGPLGYIIETRDCIVFAWKTGEKRIKIEESKQVDGIVNKITQPA